MNGLIKKILIGVFVVAVVATGGWLGRKQYKKVSERRLLAEAGKWMEKHDFRNAGLCLQRVLQINPMSAEGSRLTADLLDATGSAMSLNWRMRTCQLATNNLEYRLAWAETALKFRDSRAATQALSGVDPKDQSTPVYQKLSGALAWSLNDAVGSEKHYQQALRLEPSNQAVILNLSMIRLASTNKTVADAARMELEKTPVKSPLRIVALRSLVADAEAHKSLGKAVAFSEEIIENSAAAYPDKIARLQLLRISGSAEYKEYRRLLEEDAKASADHASVLGRWIAISEGPAQAVGWIRNLPISVQTNQPLPIVQTDCLIALKDWKKLLEAVEKKDWGEASFYRLALEALAYRGLDNNLLAGNSWQKAFRAAGEHLDRLAKLAQVATAWGWSKEGINVLQDIVAKFPNERWASDQLVTSLYAAGDTRDLGVLLEKIHAAAPSDIRLKNNLASVWLLRKSNLNSAHQLAREAYESAPENPFYIATYAYSLLLQNKSEDALKTFGSLKAEYLKIPTVAAYYGVVQAQAGHKDRAKEPLTFASNAPMLPEEKEIVRLALERL